MIGRVALAAKLSLFASPAFSLPFVHPHHDKLDRDALVARARACDGAAASHDCAQAALFLHELSSLEGRPHEAARWLELSLGPCEGFEAGRVDGLEGPDKARALFTCAMARAEAARSGNPLTALRQSGRSLAALIEAERHGPEPDDRLYAEGWVYARLPPAFGRRTAKAILSLEMLRRRQPASAADFRLARVHVDRGDETQAEAAYARAQERGDRRAALWLGEAGFSRDPTRGTKLSYGVAPALTVSPTSGLLFALTGYDDRAFDTRRSARLSLFGATKGDLGAALEAEDGQTLPEVSLGISLHWARRVEDFYGIGPGAAASAYQAVRWERAGLDFGVTREILPRFSFTLGWRAAYAFAQEGRAALDASLALDAARSFHTGPFATLALDTRDRLSLPRRGTAARISGYFPSKGLGSERNFQAIDLSFEQHFAWGLRHALSFRAGLSARDGEVPLPVYAKIGQDIRLPGTRLSRFQDRAAAGAAAEWRWELGTSVSVAAFGLAATVAPTVGRLADGAWSAGGGGAVLLHPMGPHAATRLEIARFGGETVVLARAGVGL